jgi:hypothetical protein
MNIVFEPHICGGGFFSQFNLVIQGLELYDELITRVTWNMHDAPAFQYNSGDIYKPLFEEYVSDKATLSNETATIKMFFNQNYTAHLVANKYLSKDHKEWRLRFNKVYKKYIKHTNYLDEIFTRVFAKQFEFYKDLPKVGVLIRNNNLGVEQPRKTSPTIDTYLNALNKLGLKDFVVVCAIDNKHDLNWFKTHFKTIHNSNTTRSETAHHAEPHHSSQMKLIDAAYHYLEGYALSKCDYFIHPVSNVATGALIMNPELKNVFVIG